MTEHSTRHPISRGEFLKLGGATAGVISLSACGISPTSQIATAVLEPAPTVTSEPSPTATPVPEFLPSASQDEPCVLPPPQMEGGMPLMNALANRKSWRDYDTGEIPVHILSSLLWAAFGVNRPQSGQRTAPSAHNVQDISIYLASAKGLFRFEAKAHSLIPVMPDDIRPLTVQNQANVAEAPIQLIYVSDYMRMSFPEEDKLRWSWAHSGLIAQNVYLYCASEGLASVVRTTFLRQPLEERMGLGTFEHVTMTQAVGYPKQT